MGKCTSGNSPRQTASVRGRRADSCVQYQCDTKLAGIPCYLRMASRLCHNRLPTDRSTSTVCIVGREPYLGSVFVRTVHEIDLCVIGAKGGAAHIHRDWSCRVWSRRRREVLPPWWRLSAAYRWHNRRQRLPWCAHVRGVVIVLDGERDAVQRPNELSSPRKIRVFCPCDFLAIRGGVALLRERHAVTSQQSQVPAGLLMRHTGRHDRGRNNEDATLAGEGGEPWAAQGPRAGEPDPLYSWKKGGPALHFIECSQAPATEVPP
jgi:hypothetical protein